MVARQRIEFDWLDDLDQLRSVDTPAEETHRLGLDDVVVEIDLTSVHGKELTEFLQKYLRAGRRIRGQRVATRSGSTSGYAATPHPAGIAAARKRNKRIEAWGLAQPQPVRGYAEQVAKNGYRSPFLVRAYNEAHPEDAI
jgi:hypothetical protein